MTISVERPVHPKDRYKNILKIFSALLNLNLSEREIDILDLFYTNHAGMINQTSRIDVAGRLKITEFNLNNYLRKLRKRKIVDNKSINANIMFNIMPADKNISVLITLIKPE